MIVVTFWVSKRELELPIPFEQHPRPLQLVEPTTMMIWVSFVPKRIVVLVRMRKTFFDYCWSIEIDLVPFSSCLFRCHLHSFERMTVLPFDFVIWTLIDLGAHHYVVLPFLLSLLRAYYE